MPNTASNLTICLNSCLASLVRLITGVRVCNLEFDPEKQYIFISNHTSHLDFVVIWATLPSEIRNKVSPIAAKDYWSTGFIKPWVSKKVFKAILLNRSGRGKNRNHPLQSLFDALELGRSLILFPEGTRSLNGEMKPFKAGIYSVVEKFSQTQIVPIALDNLTRVLPKGEILPLPLISKATYLPVTSLKTDESKTAFLKRLHHSISSQLQSHD